MPTERGWLRVSAITLGTALVLLIPTFDNGFPWVMNDTPQYVHHGMNLTVGTERPPGYGVFLKFSSLDVSLWFTVLVQAILTAVVTATAFRLLTSVRRPPIAALVALAVLTATTGMGLNTGMVLPDVFAPLAFLCVALLLVAPAEKLRVVDIAVLGAVLVIADVTHLSHLNATTFVGALAIVYRLVARRLRLPAIAWRRIGLVAFFVGTSWLLVPTIQYLCGGGFQTSRAAPAYMVARMAENGMLGAFLKEACPHEGWKLCDQQELIPQDCNIFLWGRAEKSPHTKNGGLIGENLREYREILLATVTSPKWIVRHATELVVATTRQLVIIDPTVVYHQWTLTYVGWVLKQEFPADYGEFTRARQQLKQVTLKDWLPGLNRWTVVLSLALLVFIYASRELRAAVGTPILLSGFFLALGLLGNAMICGGLSVPDDRYQARVIPLVPLLLALCLAQRTVLPIIVRKIRYRYT